MPTPAITNGEEQFFVTTYEGNGTGQKVGKFVPFTDSGTIDNSCIFNATTNNYLSRTPSSNGSGTTLTFSCWVKRGLLGLRDILYNGNITTTSEHLAFDASNRLHYYEVTSGSRKWDYVTNRTFEDTSKWYHIYVRRDTTDSTAADRIQIYVDGERITSFATSTQPSLNATGYWNQTTYGHYLGTSGSASYIRGVGYLAEVNMVDGSTPAVSTFGLTDTSTGRWIPKTLSGITYGTNGFRLKFQDSSVLGDDSSGNNNDFTATNLASTDQTTDSPTQNFPTFSMSGPYIGSQQSAQEGNLKIVMSVGSGYPTVRTLKEIPQSGKWYWEVKAEQVGNIIGIQNATYGVLDLNLKDVNGLDVGKPFTRQIGGMGLEMYSGAVFTGLLTSAGKTATDFTIGSTSMGDDDYIVFAFDMDNGKAWWGWNDSSAGSSVVWFANDGGTDGDPGAGTNPTVTFTSSNHKFVPTQGGYAPGSGYSANFIYNFGSKPFAFTAPTGFSGLSQNNFPETGKGKPDLIIAKNRDQADRWLWQDSLRGFGEYGSSSSSASGGGTAVQFNSAITDGVQKSLKGGFQTEDSDYSNAVNESYVSFNWVANNGVSATDTTGDLSTELQANPTAGFSIAKFTPTGSGVVTWAHGLGAVPEFGHLWTYNNTPYGTTYHHKMHATPSQYYILMSSNAARVATTNIWGTSNPTSTLWSGTVNSTFTSGAPYIFYSYVGIPGYSKFDSYVGNGNANGPFVYTGFKPRFIWIKDLTVGYSWYVFDTVRFPNNPNGENLLFNGSYNEASTGNEGLDTLSNGFKIRTSSGGTNQSGVTYIYGAFAEHPFIGDGTSPATAR